MCKEYYIIIDGQNIPVTEEVYYAFLRPVWKEHKRERMRSSREISLDELIENGIDIPDDASLVCDVVGDKLMLDMLIKALDELDDDEQSLIKALYFKDKTARRYARETNTNHTNINRRHLSIIKKLQNILHKYL